MKLKKGIVVFGLGVTLLCTSACSQTKKEMSTNAHSNKVEMTYDKLRSRENTMAVAWYQESDEAKALYLQGYHLAKQKLEMITQTPSSKPYSVILDIDETVLDNSPYQAKNVKNGKTFNPKSWDKWVKSKKAKAVPGVKEFLNYANEKGVKIYYVSDRADSQVDATKENLESEGLPVQDKSQLLFLKNEMTSKESRRKMVGESTDIALLCGDNLVDFAEFSKTSQTDRTKMMSELENEFGNKFIILPNPMYGSWETTIYNGKKLDSKRQVKAREKAIEKNSAKD